MDEDPDYYRILEIDDSADEATIKREVKANYKRLALKHHPDKNPGDENATARFQKIQHAFDILSDDSRRKEYNEGRARRSGDTAARKAREAEEQAAHARADAHKKEEQERQHRAEQQQQQWKRQQQHDRQRRQQEDQRRREEEQQRKQQQQREEQARRQREEQRQRDEKGRQDEQRRQDKQQRTREGYEAHEKAEKQPDPGIGQPEHAKSFLKWINDFVQSAAPAPISRLFTSIQSNWTPAHWWWLLGFILVWIAWSLRGSSTPGVPRSEPRQVSRAPPLPAPLDEMLKGLRTGRSLGEVQTRFANNCNLPYELQLKEPVVGALIDDLDGRSSVEMYWDCSSNAVDGVVEAYLVTDRLIAEVEKTIEAAMSQLEGMILPQPPLYYRLIGTHTTTSSRRTDEKVRQVLIPMADSIYDTLDRAVMILRTTEHSLGMLLETLDNIAISAYGKNILDEYPRERVGAGGSWKFILIQLQSTRSGLNKAKQSDYFYSDTSEARKEISKAGAAMVALQDRLLVFQRALQDAPLTALESTLELCASVLRSDRSELRTSQSGSSRTRKEKRRHRSLCT